MTRTMRLIAQSAVGVLVLLYGGQAAVRAQASQVVSHLASLAPGAIHGVVQDEKGLPVAGAMVSALGSSSAFAVTDRSGRFELRPLPPGPYLVRAHLSGFDAPRGQVVRVLPSARASSSIALRRVNAVTPPAPPPIVQAGFGAAPPADTVRPDDPAPPTAASTGAVDSGEIAWRLSHARRSILKDVDQAIAGTNASK